MALPAMQSYTVPLSSSVGVKEAVKDICDIVSLESKVILVPPGGVAPISLKSASGTAVTTQVAIDAFPLGRKTTGEYSVESI